MLANLQGVFERKPTGAVAAFNVFGYEDARAVIDAAEALGQPVILMTNKPAIQFMPMRLLGPLLLEMARAASMPVCVHLDHSTSLEDIKEAIDLGYTSVMFDGSRLPDERNVELTRAAIAMARPRGVSVEAEIGSVGYADQNIAGSLTRPEGAKAFADKTGVDALAVAVGTEHRMTMQAARIDFELLRAIRAQLAAPLVIHGSTGVPDADLRRLAQAGARKVNIGTALRMAFGGALRQAFEAQPEAFDRLTLFPAAMGAVRTVAKNKMKRLTID